MKPDLISRTGRVQNWLDDPDGRLPVSCTTIVVEDSMTEGRDSIEASWKFASHALRFGAGCAVHLSNLRPKGHDNGQGLTASGPVSFAKIYSTLNETLRRGGKFKNGAITCVLDIDHADILGFLSATRDELPWVKRCVNLNTQMWHSASDRTRDLVLHGIKSGDIWLNKIRYGKDGKRIYNNVCLEVYLPSRGTCLLQHVNLGACMFDDIPQAFYDGMSQLCDLHGRTGVGRYGEYLPPETDRQVGLGMLGLANLLGRYGVTYKDFGHALARINHGEKTDGYTSNKADTLANQFQMGIDMAANVAVSNRMERAFAIAPTASVSYRSRTVDGYTSCPEIAPPIARTVDRDSGTFGVERFDYGLVEIASEVGWEDYKRVADELVFMLSNTGLLHGYSFNSWSDVVTYDNNFVEEWLASPQTSLYYSLQVMGDVQDKSDAYAALSETEVEDYLKGLLEDEEITCDCQE